MKTPIPRRDFLKTLGISTAAFTLGCGALRSSRPRRKPNFLFIIADDLGWRDLGCYGSKFYESPAIDRLAAEGVKFTNGYAAAPVCSPTRVSLMTGKHPARVGLTNWLSGHIKNKLIEAPYIEHLPLEEVTIAEAMKEASYKTFFAGKWHLGPKGYWPEDQGFDINIGGTNKGGPYEGGGYFPPYANERLKDGPPGEYLPDRLAAETNAFIEQNTDKPFFACLSFYSVHEPLMTTKALEDKYRKKAENFPPTQWGREAEKTNRLTQDHPVYAGMIEGMDQAVAKVTRKLKDLGLYDDTVIVFVSDNGGLSTDTSHPTANVPLRAGKGWLYEGGIRVPLIIKWPGVTKPGSVCDEPVYSADFYPTFLQMAGLPLKPKQHQDAVSLVPLLKGGASLGREALYFHYPHYAPQGGRPSSAIRKGDFKLIEYYEDGRIELFNLRDDISETKDLSKSMPDKARELHQMLKAWRAEVGAKLPSPNPKYKETERARPR